MLKIFFVRHGETVWNTLGIFQGRSDSPLTELGISQAEKLSEYLKDTNFHKFYSSPQKRAMETAKIIVKNHDLQILEIPEFQEIAMGKVEGIPKEDFKNKYSEEYNNFWNNAELYNPAAYDGESYANVLSRIEKGIQTLVTENFSETEDRTIIVVTHGVTLKGIFTLINNKGISEFSKQEVPENTSLTVVEYDGNIFKTTSFSDTTHLK